MDPTTTQQARKAGRTRQRQTLTRERIPIESPLLGGTLVGESAQSTQQGEAGSLEHLYDTSAEPARDPRALQSLIPGPDADRQVDDWGRSQRVYDMLQPLLDFYYHYWFRVDQEGVENVPAAGGALLVSNHSGALPPDAPMLMQTIRHEHPSPRPLYMMGEHWFKGYPGVGLLTNKIGLVAAHPANADRLLRDEQRLALVFPEGQKGTRKLYWQRYKLRRFGRGGYVKTALRNQVPIVPVAVLGAEEAMPIFAHVRLLQKLTGLIYFPINHAFPHFGLAAALAYLPAKFKIRFLEPVYLDHYGPDAADDVGLVHRISEQVRGRIQRELNRLISTRSSVWFG